MILAAGRGERLRPLTDTRPKPLLPVRGKPLMQWSMEALARGGVRHLVVNIAWLGEQISDYFGAQFLLPEDPAPDRIASVAPDGVAMGILYSNEQQDFGGVLETAGGICRALPKLGDIFWAVAGDVFVPGFAFSATAVQRFAREGKLAHLWLVPNPLQHPAGDFGLLPADPRDLTQGQLALAHADVRYTYSAIGLFRRELFSPPYCDIPFGNPHGVKAKLAPILRAAMDDAQVTAELYTGEWTDVGTPERLAELNANWSPEE
ncbi:MAG: nucleotidyltransferase family protein [Burkholderiaceae bacterium]